MAKDKGKKKKAKEKKLCEGRSLLDMMWEELMAVYERLVSGAAAADGRDPGRAEGIAFCIAIVQQPYNPDIESVREEAMRRWDEKELEAQSTRELSDAEEAAENATWK